MVGQPTLSFAAAFDGAILIETRADARPRAVVGSDGMSRHDREEQEKRRERQVSGRAADRTVHSALPYSG